MFQAIYIKDLLRQSLSQHNDTQLERESFHIILKEIVVVSSLLSTNDKTKALDYNLSILYDLRGNWNTEKQNIPPQDEGQNQTMFRNERQFKYHQN